MPMQSTASRWTPEARARASAAMRLRANSPGFQEKKNAGREAARKAKLQQELATIKSPAMIALPVPTESPALALAVLPNETNGVNGHGDADEQKTPERKAHWDQNERRTVAVEVARLIRKQGWRHVPEPHDRTGRTLLTDFVFAAQQLLPRERRRKTKSPAALGDIFWTLVEAALTTKADLAPPVAAALPPVASELASETPENGAGPVASSPLMPPPGQAIVPESDPLRDVPLAALLQATFRRILVAVDQAQTANRRTAELEELNVMQAEDISRMRKDYEQVQARLAALDTAVQMQPAKVGREVPKVAIIGCEKFEFNKIAEACRTIGLRLDLRHHDRDDAKIITGDWAILLPWANHTWREKAKATMENGKWMAIDGGARKAVDQLKIWFQPE